MYTLLILSKRTALISLARGREEKGDKVTEWFSLFQHPSTGYCVYCEGREGKGDKVTGWFSVFQQPSTGYCECDLSWCKCFPVLRNW